MRHSLSTLVLVLALASACKSAPSTERAPELARRFLILDGHIDVPYRLHEEAQHGEMDDVSAATEGGDFDYPRAVAGGLDAPFFSIYTPSEDEAAGTSKKVADELLDLCDGLIRAHPEQFELARTAADVRRIKNSARIAILYGMENGSPIAGDLENLRHFFERGVRYITLTHAQDNHICDSSYDPRHSHSGLTRFGRQVVARMNELGVLIDVSHVSDDSFWQVLALTRAPVIASHSSLRHFVPGFERDMSDEMVRALGKNGGVIQINFGSSFLTAEANRYGEERKKAVDAYAAAHGGPGSAESRTFAEQYTSLYPFPYARVSDVADHIERVVRLAGVDHVGLGSDFDGVGDSLPIGLKDVSMYPNLIAELLRRGWNERDIEKVCGTNVLRVLERAEAVARELAPAARTAP